MTLDGSCQSSGDCPGQISKEKDVFKAGNVAPKPISRKQQLFVQVRTIRPHQHHS